MEFEFATANRILFGPGKLRELPAVVKGFGGNVLVVTGRRRERALPALELLRKQQIDTVTFPVPGEPTVDDVRRGVALARAEHCRSVIGFGGGSALDTAKAIAALLSNSGDLFDYLEVVGQGRPLLHPAAPCVAVPTTAGTGTEVTRNSVLASLEHRFKVSLRSPYLLPRLALIDPELTYDLSRELTVNTGLDALTQLVEPFVSHRANPMTDALCLEGLQRVGRSLRPVAENGRDLRAREEMSFASLCGGLALANAGLGAVHGFAAPIGGMFTAPHGAVCAALLPHATRVNVEALEQRQPGCETLQRYARIGQVLRGSASGNAADTVAWIAQLCSSLAVRSLGSLGVRRDDFGELVEKAGKASSMKANPIALTPAELHRILELAF